MRGTIFKSPGHYRLPNKPSVPTANYAARRFCTEPHNQGGVSQLWMIPPPSAGKRLDQARDAASAKPTLVDDASTRSRSLHGARGPTPRRLHSEGRCFPRPASPPKRSSAQGACSPDRCQVQSCRALRAGYRPREYHACRRYLPAWCMPSMRPGSTRKFSSREIWMIESHQDVDHPDRDARCSGTALHQRGQPHKAQCCFRKLILSGSTGGRRRMGIPIWGFSPLHANQ